MLVAEINKELIGKKVSFNFTGLRSIGVITELIENEYSKGVVVKFDSPIQWGDYSYTKNEFTARKHDNFGSLSNVFIIPNEGDLVIFEYSPEYRKVETVIGHFCDIFGDLLIDLSFNKTTNVLNTGKETFNLQKIQSLRLASKEEKEVFDNEVAEYINC